MTKILIDEALRLADAIQLGWLENVDADKADIDMIQTELRRLHAENQALRQALSDSVEQPAQENSPWCMKMNGCKTKCEDCPDEVPKQPAPAQEPLSDEQCCHVCGKPLKTVAHGVTKGNT
jgi:Zn finger protein HypA/HybF involved in hydrogenase expression